MTMDQQYLMSIKGKIVNYRKIIAFEYGLKLVSCFSHFNQSKSFLLILTEQYALLITYQISMAGLSKSIETSFAVQYVIV
jgi:hypothetical protein